MNLEIIKTEEEKCFERIANDLLKNYAIETHDSIYRFTEIEFYWYDEKHHKDFSTYPRKHVDPNNGEWFFHYSGVDIALKNENGHGGILIRGIYDLKPKSGEKQYYDGPLVCNMRLFSGLNAFNSSLNIPHIIPYNHLEVKLEQTPRKGLRENAKQNNAHLLPYRFFIEKSQFKNTL